LTFTHSTLRCGHNHRCCNSHVKRPQKGNNNNQIVPFPFDLAGLFFWFLVYRRSSGGEEFRGRRVQLWRVSAHLSMTHGHLKFINSLYSLLQVFSYWIISPYARLYTIRFHLVGPFGSTSWHFSHFVFRHKVWPISITAEMD
jgi:hypothetical protein